MADGTTVTISNPDLVATKTVDKSGRLYLGEEYAGEEIRIIIERSPGGDSDE